MTRGARGTSHTRAPRKAGQQVVIIRRSGSGYRRLENQPRVVGIDVPVGMASLASLLVDRFRSFRPDGRTSSSHLEACRTITLVLSFRDFDLFAHTIALPLFLFSLLFLFFFSCFSAPVKRSAGFVPQKLSFNLDVAL